MDDKMQVLIDLIIQKSKARNDLQKELKELQKDAQIKTDIKVNMSDVRKARKELEQFSGKALNEVKFNIDTEKYSTDIAKITAQLGRYGDASDSVFAKAKSSADSLIKTYKEMESAFGDNSSKYTDDQRVEIERRYQQELAKTKNLLAQLNINKDNEIVSVGDEKRVNMINTLNNYLSKNTAITRGSKEQIREWIRILSSSDDMTIGSIKNINTEFKTLDATMRQAGKLGLSWTDKLKQTWEKFGGWSIATGALTKSAYEVRQAVTELKELDNILTEISKTSDLTATQLERLGNSAFDTASKYGKKASDYLTGVQEMYRAGFENAEQMAELSVLAQSAGDMDATAANNYLMATNAAYKYKGSIEELNKVLDGQNYITNNAAISMKDISDATSETASVAAQYGVQIDELSALIATATANTRESGSEVGTALKAIMINLQDTTSKPVTETFDALGISMTKVVDGTERLKTPIELIYELADAYNRLPEGDVMRANILNEIGQKRHANTLASILSDMEGFEDMLDLYNNSSAEGSALREAGKSANNLEGSLNRLSNSWTKLVNSFVNSKGLTSAVNSLNDLVNVAQDLIDKFGAIPMLIIGIGTALGTIKGVKDGGLGKIIMDAAAGGFKKIDIRTEVDSTEVDALQAKIATLDGDEVKIRAAVDESSLRDIPGLADYAVDQANKGETIDAEGVNILNTNYIAQQAQGYKGVNAAMQKYNELRKEGNGAELKFAETVGKSNKNLGKYLKGLNGANAGMFTYGISLVKATVKTVALQAATMALNAVISFGISAAISGLITLFDKLHTSESEAADAAADAYEKAAEQAEKVKQKEDIAISGAEKLSDIFESEDWGTEAAEQAAKVYEDMANRLEELYGHENDRVKLLRDEADRLKDVNYLTAEQQEEERKRAMRIALGITDINDYGELESDVNTKYVASAKARAALRDKMEKKDSGMWDYEVDANGEYYKRHKEDYEPVESIGGKSAYASVFKIKGGVINSDLKMKNRDIFSDLVEEKLQNWLNVNRGTAVFHMGKGQIRGGYADSVQAMEGFIKTVEELANTPEQNGENINNNELYQEAVKIVNLVNEEYKSVQKAEDEEWDMRLHLKAAKWLNDKDGFSSDQDIEDFKKHLISPIKSGGKEGGYSSKRVNKFFDDYIKENKSIYYTPEYQEELEAREKAKAAQARRDAFKDSVKNKELLNIDDIKATQEAISPVSKAFTEMSQNGYVTTETLQKLGEAAKLSGDEWKSYEEKLLGAKKGSAEFEKVMSDITATILRETLGINGLSTATDKEFAYIEERLALALKQAGVDDPTGAAYENLMRIKAEEIINSKLESGVTQDNIKALIAEAGSVDMTRDAFVNLVAQVGIFNNEELDTKQKANALKQLLREAITTGGALSSVLNGAPIEGTAEEQQTWADANGYSITEKIDANGNPVMTVNSQGVEVNDWIWVDKSTGKAYETIQEAALAKTGAAGITLSAMLKINPDEITDDQIKEAEDAFNALLGDIDISLSDIESASNKIKTLSDTFNQLNDDGYITAKTLSDIREATGLSGDEWAEYESKLLNIQKGTAEYNQIMSEMTYKILDHEFAISGLTNATKEEIDTIEKKIALALKEQGVDNATAVARDYLMQVRAREMATALEQTDVTADNIQALIDEAGYAEADALAMYDLIAAEIYFNNNDLDVSQKVNALYEVATAAGVAASALLSADTYKAAMEKQGKGWTENADKVLSELGVSYITESERTDKGHEGKGHLYTYNGVNYEDRDDVVAAAAYNRANKGIDSLATTPSAYTPVTPIYTSKDSKKDKEKDKKDDAEKKALEALKKSLDARKEVIERYKEFIELTDFGLDLSQEDDFGLKTELLTGKISQLTSYGQAMREEFDRIANTIPNTSDEAEALASRLKSLGSDMRSNITEIRKTKIELQKLTINMASTLIDDRMGELQGQLDDIDSQIKILNSDYKDDFSHVSRMLSMNMLLPSYSDFGVSRAKLSNANRDLIRGEQETQNIINDMIETQIAKNEELREEERQAILADMETMRQDVILHLNNVSEDYESSWDSISTETNDGIGTIENAINNMDLTIPEPDISNVVRACELVKEMLDNMGDAEYTPPKIKVTDGIDGGDDAKSIVSGNRSNIVSNVAKNQLGVPYVWGGIAPGIGLDCSGLTQYAYRVAGVSLPRVADDQWRCGIGTVVDWGNLKKGDQLFFGDDGHASHTGIYVGNGQMIHAPRTGDVIKYSSINNEYYQGRFLGAKRYAVGTPGGNALAKNLGIAGENYKPEILVDKATGETTYIDTPTVIDVSKTDVVGEKATASIPKFATGTPTSDPELLSIVKRVCEATGIPANVLLSVIDQETGNKWYNGIMDSNGYKSYGYMMINDSYINGLNSGYANKVRTDPYTNVLEGAKILLDNFAKLGNWADAASAYNQGLGGFQKNGRNKYGNDVWNRANTKAFLNALEGVDDTGDIPTTVSAQELIQVLEEEYQKAIDWGLKPYLEEIKNGTVQSVFGNVDMDKRTIITWSDELKKTYKNALASWEYDPEVGSVDTVFGGSGRFGEDINGAGWEVAFTPILPNGTFLSKDTVYDYINNILVEAYGNDNQVTADELKAIDAEGRQVGETFVNGIFAAIDDSLSYDNNGNWAETVGRLMHFSGDFGAVELARSDVGKLLSTEKIEDFYDLAVSEIGKANSKYSTQYLDILNDRSLGDFEKNEQLYDIQYAMGLNSSKIGTDIYDFVYGQYRNWLADVEANPENWDYDTHESFVETLKKLNEFAYKSADDAVSSKQAAAEMRWSNSEGWISDRNFFNDWGLFDDTEVDAWERVVAWLKKEYPKEVSKIKDAEKNLFEARKKEFDKANTFSNTYLESQKTLLQSHFDVTNAVAEARHEINKELETSMTMYEYLDEDTRKLLFNQEDYNALSEELLNIQNKANNLQKQYEADLSNSTLDTIESITSNYQMQYETLMKSYEIAKADLEVAKKKAKLNNVLNERNVRMFVNGSWQWVADTENVANAKSELADAEYEKQTSQTNLEQQNSLNALTRQQDELSVVMKKFESGIIGLNEAVGLATKVMGNMPGELYKIYLNSTRDTKAYYQGAASGTYEGTWYDGVTDYMDEILKASSREDVLALNAARTAKIKGGNLKEAILSDEEAIAKWREQVIAKMHTNSKDWHSADDETKKALAAQNQIWGEAIGSTYDKVTGSWSHDGIFVPISPSSIFNSDMFGGDVLKNMGTLWNTGFNIGTGALSAVQPQQVDQSQDNRIIINGMTVDTGTMAGKDLYDALLRFVGNH